MPVIDPDGYFGGDRFDDVSDVARMMWPSFYIASNTMGRLELNYFKVTAKAFSRWKVKPTEQEFWDLIQEYTNAYLLFVYQATDGQLWGQWDTSERFLARHKLAADLRGPAPVGNCLTEWRADYIAHKTGKCNAPTNFVNLAQNFAGLRGNVRGIGIGIGSGKGLCAANGKANGRSQPTTTAEVVASPVNGSASPKANSSSTPRGTRFHEQSLPSEWEAFCRNKLRWSPDRIAETYAMFSDFWTAKVGQDACKMDWLATWRLWCRNEHAGKFSGTGRRPHPMTDRDSVASLPVYAPAED